MATSYKTPGVYIQEENAFPNSAVAVETAVPVFIGYTEKALRNGKSLLRKPTKINSFAEYVEIFGKGFKPKFTVGGGAPASAAGATGTAPATDAGAGAPATTDTTAAPAGAPVAPAGEAGAGAAAAAAGSEATAPAAGTPAATGGAATPTVTPPVAGGGISLDAIKINDKNTAYFYNSIRLFYANGGSSCYILSVGTYEDQTTLNVKSDDYLGTTTVFDLLVKEFEPTMIVMPDAIVLGEGAYNTVYTAALKHCSDVQSRVCIFDLRKQLPTDVTDDLVEKFRTGIGSNFLNYGTAYYPWLKTAVVQADELDYRNIDSSLDLATGLVAPNPKNDPLITKNNGNIQKIVSEFSKKTTPTPDEIKNFHQSLIAASPIYTQILEEIRSQLNELPPSGAMAGIYTMVDNTRGVWKAPANVSLSLVDAPSLNVSDREQESLNVDVMGGKSINVIRPFPGIGTLVWGGRTLDGNSQDWRYINVRRTLIMIEQSLKLATRAYVFEPNDAGTWITIKSMISNFLNNLWKQGALAGAAPEVAYDVQIGLGATMTPNDILDGIMRITVKVAIVHPAEFIVITFQQLQQQS
ncbi:MAG TPA: phage tail sheath C-terminal domain-containing protein [Puia sp.]|nr:phage tail sheath C-terminal domain-containing protein [Puia sp.]